MFLRKKSDPFLSSCLEDLIEHLFVNHKKMMENPSPEHKKLYDDINEIILLLKSFSAETESSILESRIKDHIQTYFSTSGYLLQGIYF